MQQVKTRGERTTSSTTGTTGNTGPAPSGSTAASKPSAPVIQLGAEPIQDERLLQIQTRAYYKAEARGFEPGHELDDWLEAEREQQESTVRPRLN